MNKRLLIITILVMLVIGGMIAGLFMGSIQNALTLPMMRMMGDGAEKQGQVAVKPGGQVQNTPLATKGSNINATPNANQDMLGQNNTQANVLAQDTFQRANQQLWGAASDGRQWEGDANVAPAFSVANATGRIANGQGTLNAVLGSPIADAEVTASGSVNQFTGNTNFGVVLRWSDGDNWYKALLDGTHLNVLKRVNGQSTTLRSVHFLAQTDRVYMLRFRAIGAMLFARAWRVDQTEPNRWLTIISDNDLTTGRTGLRVVVQPTTVINITSFTARSATMNGDNTL
ncbi:MAG: hypothetical protein NVS4B9_15020 [Ktedonobacteraceae bacterium]